MKAFLKRLAVTVLVLALTLTLCFQNAALAGPRADDGESRSVASHQRHEASGGGGGGGASWWSRFKQGKPIRDRGVSPGVSEGAERRNPSNDRERREIVREVTRERHMPGGGPQDN